MSLVGLKLGPSVTNRMEAPMSPDTLDRLVFHIAGLGLIALVVLPW